MNKASISNHTKLQLALVDMLDATSISDIVHATGITHDRATEIRTILHSDGTEPTLVLEDALTDMLDGMSVHDIKSAFGLSAERSQELYDICAELFASA